MIAPSSPPIFHFSANPTNGKPHHEIPISQLLLVRLTPSKACYLLEDIRRPCFSAHVVGGVARFGSFLLLLVLLRLNFCFSASTNSKIQLLGLYWSDWPQTKLVVYYKTNTRTFWLLILGVACLFWLVCTAFSYGEILFLLFHIGQFESAIARIIFVKLTSSKAWYLLEDTIQPCFGAPCRFIMYCLSSS